MTELQGIFVIIALVVGAIIYYLHTEAGKAKLATLEANVKAEVAKVQGQITTAEANLKAHVSSAVAASSPPAATPAAPVVAAPAVAAPAAPQA